MEAVNAAVAIGALAPTQASEPLLESSAPDDSVAPALAVQPKPSTCCSSELVESAASAREVPPVTLESVGSEAGHCGGWASDAFAEREIIAVRSAPSSAGTNEVLDTGAPVSPKTSWEAPEATADSEVSCDALAISGPSSSVGATFSLALPATERRESPSGAAEDGPAKAMAVAAVRHLFARAIAQASAASRGHAHAMAAAEHRNAEDHRAESGVAASARASTGTGADASDALVGRPLGVQQGIAQHGRAESRVAAGAAVRASFAHAAAGASTSPGPDKADAAIAGPPAMEQSNAQADRRETKVAAAVAVRASLVYAASRASKSRRLGDRAETKAAAALAVRASFLHAAATASTSGGNDQADASLARLPAMAQDNVEDDRRESKASAAAASRASKSRGRTETKAAAAVAVRASFVRAAARASTSAGSDEAASNARLPTVAQYSTGDDRRATKAAAAVAVRSSFVHAAARALESRGPDKVDASARPSSAAQCDAQDDRRETRTAAAAAVRASFAHAATRGSTPAVEVGSVKDDHSELKIMVAIAVRLLFAYAAAQASASPGHDHLVVDSVKSQNDRAESQAAAAFALRASFAHVASQPTGNGRSPAALERGSADDRAECRVVAADAVRASFARAAERASSSKDDDQADADGSKLHPDQDDADPDVTRREESESIRVRRTSVATVDAVFASAMVRAAAHGDDRMGLEPGAAGKPPGLRGITVAVVDALFTHAKAQAACRGSMSGGDLAPPPIERKIASRLTSELEEVSIPEESPVWALPVPPAPYVPSSEIIDDCASRSANSVASAIAEMVAEQVPPSQGEPARQPGTGAVVPSLGCVSTCIVDVDLGGTATDAGRWREPRSVGLLELAARRPASSSQGSAVLSDCSFHAAESQAGSGSSVDAAHSCGRGLVGGDFSRCESSLSGLESSGTGLAAESSIGARTPPCVPPGLMGPQCFELMFPLYRIRDVSRSFNGPQILSRKG